MAEIKNIPIKKALDYDGNQIAFQTPLEAVQNSLGQGLQEILDARDTELKNYTDTKTSKIDNIATDITDNEDLTTDHSAEHPVLRFADRDLSNGKGYIILRKNLVTYKRSGVEIIIGTAPSTDTTAYVKFGGEVVPYTAKAGCTTLDIVNQIKRIISEKYPSIEFTSDSNTLIAWNPIPNGSYPVIDATDENLQIIQELHKNDYTANVIDTTKLSQKNTIYEIRYNYTLQSGKLAFPENSILSFVGGTISNGTISGKNLVIASSYYPFEKVTYTNAKFVGCIPSGPSTDRPILVESQAGFQYYDTTINSYIYWNGSAWVNSDGSSLTDSKSGPTASRPNLPEGKYVGYEYYDTDLNEFIRWNGKDWISSLSGYPAKYPTSGPSKNRPTLGQGENIGFLYYDTTLRQPIYWEGNDWYDATGHRSDITSPSMMTVK